MDRGADLERLRTLAGKFRDSAGDLRGLISTLDTETQSSESYWKGPKSDQFRSEWQDVKPTFESFADALDDAAQNADTNADNIEAAT
ncbi:MULTISPECIES: WXG100 family type VII secretion target [Streptomyces]|uniref:WXG100 family type VII secretion target n=1 Tax=Streptomyces harbinensis TaxID=1176198 RepID=A0A1I6UTZ7_9ACTN|nr:MULTISPECIES: WXG100 family type VII secretion target [Streptomyces]QKV69234.1 WXG100 family type VII secretion target [Streptomyces harbinensis]SFT04876.1 WXG100 family type VII secretion target [Streptomyces harbinensis]